MQFKNIKKQDGGDNIFSVEAGRRKGMSRKTGILEQTAWSSHYTRHRDCMNKTWPSAPGQEVHGIRFQVLVTNVFQQEGSTSNPLWSKTGYK